MSIHHYDGSYVRDFERKNLRKVLSKDGNLLQRVEELRT